MKHHLQLPVIYETESTPTCGYIIMVLIVCIQGSVFLHLPVSIWNIIATSYYGSKGEVK